MKLKSLLNFPKLIRNVWISLWIVLIILLVIKLLFNKWYPIVIENNTLISFSGYIDAHYILKFSLASILYLISTYFITLIAARSKCFKYYIMIPLFILAIGINVIKSYNNTLGMLCEILILVVFPIIYNIKTKAFNKLWLNIVFPIIVNLIVIIWQLNILFIRDINELLKNMPFIISVVLQLDYYIFLIITWIGVAYFMSIFGSWFFEEQLNYFKSLKERELKKKNPDSVVLEDIDRQIAYYENKIKEAKA